MDDVDEPLGRNHDFKTLLSTQGVSSIGDAVSFTALPLLVFALTGSGAVMGLVGALQTLPDLFFGMVAGALADRSDRKRMMFLADLGRALLTALIPISVWLGGPTLVVILIVAAPMSILRSFFLAGYTASVPADRRALAARPRQRPVRGRLQHGLHPRAGRRGHPLHADRPRADPRDRRGQLPPVRLSACSSSAARSSPRPTDRRATS